MCVWGGVRICSCVCVLPDTLEVCVCVCVGGCFYVFIVCALRGGDVCACGGGCMWLWLWLNMCTHLGCGWLHLAILARGGCGVRVGEGPGVGLA